MFEVARPMAGDILSLAPLGTLPYSSYIEFPRNDIGPRNCIMTGWKRGLRLAGLQQSHRFSLYRYFALVSRGVLHAGRRFMILMVALGGH
jgi:hypothetical protein